MLVSLLPGNKIELNGIGCTIENLEYLKEQFQGLTSEIFSNVTFVEKSAYLHNQ
jgi:hypothetical protein